MKKIKKLSLITWVWLTIIGFGFYLSSYSSGLRDPSFWVSWSGFFSDWTFVFFKVVTFDADKLFSDYWFLANDIWSTLFHTLLGIINLAMIYAHKIYKNIWTAIIAFLGAFIWIVASFLATVTFVSA